jgi:hypothetical protein
MEMDSAMDIAGLNDMAADISLKLDGVAKVRGIAGHVLAPRR